jgi:ATP-dependent RNA helicase DeaD
VGRTGRLSSADAKGAAFTFVCKDEGPQLTAIEKRIDKILAEYRVQDFEAYRPRAPRQHVKDIPATVPVPEFDEEAWHVA